MLVRLICAVLALPLLSCGTGPADDASARPNIILVSIDTLRADSTSLYRGPLATPGFEALASRGVVFDRAYAPAPETGPSHATLFTGQEVLRHGVIRNGVPLPAEKQTLAEEFRDAGYATAAFVSSWVLDARFGWDQGFGVYDASFSEDGATMNKEHNRYPGALWLDHEFEGLDRRASVTNEAVGGWLADAAEPYFLFVHYFDPHGPYLPPREVLPRLRDVDVDLEGRSVRKIGPRKLRSRILRYYGEILYVDDALIDLVARIERKDASRPTLLVVTADHGEALGNHGWMEHSIFLYDELIRIPLLFVWLDPQSQAVRIEVPVSLGDIAPTLMELAHLAPLDEADGHSLARSVRDGSPPLERPIFAHRRAYDPESYEGRPGFPGRMASVRNSRWKLIRNWDASDELYDLRADPGELANRIDDEDDVRTELGALLDAHLSRFPAAEVPHELTPEDRRKLEALGYFE